MQNSMNRHSFLQFNPNCYKKHLSPFGRNVLDTLIKHWRTGFDSNENRRQHQFSTNQNRRNTSDFCGYSRSIPSVPSSPASGPHNDREIGQITNFDSNNYPIPELALRQDSYPSTTSLDQADYEKAETAFNNDKAAMPRIPVERTSEPSQILVTCNKDVLRQANTTKRNSSLQQHNARDEIKKNSMVFPETSIKQTLLVGANGELPNEFVLTSGDLAKTVDISNTNEEEILTANDMITPVININKINENLLSSKHFDKIDNCSMPAKTFLEILNKETNEEKCLTRDELMRQRNENIESVTITKNVDWDNMFDTELISDLKIPLQLGLPVECSTNKTTKFKFPKDNKRKLNKIVNKVSKPKTKSKLSKAASKKIKQIPCVSNELENVSNVNLRKIKYTEAVKTWLDDVDSYNVLEEEVDVPMNETSETITPNIPTMHDIMYVAESYSGNKKYAIPTNKVVDIQNIPKEISKNKLSGSLIRSQIHGKGQLVINGAEERSEFKPTIPIKKVNVKELIALVIEKKTKAKSKKTVQSKLAEKDGKMKFGPPVKEQNESTTEHPDDKESKNEETKEKKVKAKFVPPIKSQIPVKNVTFDVNKIDEDNVNLIHDMIKSDENEIAIVLIYSNGFCQLNDHHTEESCVPEGVLIQSHEKFFYLKDNQHFRDLMKPILEKSVIICYNGKRLLIHLVSKYDLELKPDLFNMFDAKIGASLIDPDNPPENFAELQKLLGFTPEFTIATECVLQKAAWYTTLLTECYDKLKSSLIQNSVWNVFVEIEMPLLPVIAGMEYQGVWVDLEKLKAMEEILLTKMKAVEQDCYKAAGKTFQINSTLQVRTILYDELQLDTKSNLKIKETIGKGAKSTSETMLRGLVSVHSLPRLILEYRHLHKAHATFLTGISQHVKDGTVKPTWEQMAAATGRIASNNPNLQAIPKAPFSLVLFPEKSNEHEPKLNFRSVYTARPQHMFFAADFKHIECRVFAHAANDATLQDALRSDQDLFRVLAAKWLNKPVEDVYTEDRERTKRIVYASLYGAGARKLMEILQVSYEQALSVMSSFNRTFPALKSFGRAVAARAGRAGRGGGGGGLRSLSGRARRLPHIGSADAGLRAQAERQAVNFVVQGSAADLCKKAMVSVQRRLSPALQCRLLLQIHDELVWEVAEEHLVKVAAIIKEAMENVGRECGMDMTLPVELTCGRNWGEMQAF